MGTWVEGLLFEATHVPSPVLHGSPSYHGPRVLSSEMVSRIRSQVRPVILNEVGGGLGGLSYGRFPSGLSRCDAADRQLPVPRYWVAGPHFKCTVVGNKEYTNRHYLTIDTNNSTASATIIK